MSEISIQVRRVTERVKKYYKVFGFRSTAMMRPGRSVIRGGRRLGFDEIECVVAETARGTSVGFYTINAFQGLIYMIPFLFVYLLHLLNKIEGVSKYITGDDKLFEIDWLKLFSGNATLDIKFTLVFLLLGLIPLMLEFVHQRIRLANLKSRFSFFTRDAIWDTREAPSNLIALLSSRSVIIHSWILSILYFSLFSFPSNTIGEIISLYKTNSDDLYYATADAFSMTVGLVIGLLSADKAIRMRKENSLIDKRSRITGSLLERRIDPIFYGIQAAAYSVILFGLLMSVTYLKGVSFDIAFQMLAFALLGGLITGLIHSEGPLWVSSAYGILIFFSSLIYIFRTGANPEYAFIVIIQLFIIPFPFILLIARSFDNVLKKEGIKSSDWLYDVIPLLPMISITIQNRHRKIVQKKYLEDMDREIEYDSIDDRIRIKKELLMDKSSPGHKLAMHYYELLMSYTASFDDDKFIYIPTTNQLITWWEEKTGKNSDESQINFLDSVDRLLWDPSYLPYTDKLTSDEIIGRKMVLAIK